MAEAKGVTPIKLLVAITLVTVAAAAMGCLTGDSGGGPAAKPSDPAGSGINPAGVDPSTPVAVEPKKSTSVPVKHFTEKEFQRFSKGKIDIKEGVLYLYEYKYEYEAIPSPLDW